MKSLDKFIREKEDELNLNISKAELEDAEFILNLRTNPEKAKFLNTTAEDYEGQKEWLKEYKIRETSFSELYFVFRWNEQSIGTIRFIKKTKTCFESGSWFFISEIPFDLSIRGEIFCKDLGFEFFLLESCYFRVFKTHKQVLRYHQLFNPKIIKEDNEFYYFSLPKKEYLRNRNKIVNYLGI